MATYVLPDMPYDYAAPDYVRKLWSLVNWADVTRRFTEVRGK